MSDVRRPMQRGNPDVATMSKSLSVFWHGRHAQGSSSEAKENARLHDYVKGLRGQSTSYYHYANLQLSPVYSLALALLRRALAYAQRHAVEGRHLVLIHLLQQVQQPTCM